MKLIDADELEKVWTIASPEPYSTDAAEVLDSIRGAPTVDAVPVVHGRWEWVDDGYCRCSECRQRAPVVYGVLVEDWQDEPRTVMTYYCPNCGAKMDLEGENE